MASPPSGFTVRPAPGWVAAIEPDWKAPPAREIQSGRECLLSHHEERVSPEGVEEYFHGAWRVASQPGLDATSQIRVDFDATYQSLILHFVRIRRDGATLDRLDPAAVKVIERQRNLDRQIYDGHRSAVLFVPDLRVGDVIEYAYTKRGADPTLAGKYSGRVVLGASEPVGRLYARVLMPRGRSIRTSSHGPGRGSAELEPALHEIPYGTEVVWDRTSPALYPVEPNQPASFVPFPWAELTEYDSWKEVADHARRLFAILPLSPRTRSVVETWRREAKSRDDLILRAVRFVQDEVRYVGLEVGNDRRRPADPNVVFERRFGDCKDKSALLVALLRAVDVTAYPALVSATPGMSLKELDPDLGAFDHVIVRVGPIDGTSYWVDATASGQGGGLDRLRFSDLEWALLLAEGTTELDPLPPEPSEDPSVLVRETFSLPQPGTGSEGQLEFERIYERSVADNMRRQLKSQTQEQRSKYYLDIYTAIFPSIREQRPVEYIDEREKDRLRVVGHYVLPEVWSWEETAQRFVVTTTSGLFQDLLPEPGSTERKTPLFVPHPVHARQITALSVPTALNITPGDVSVDGPAFQLHVSSAYQDRTVTYNFDFEAKSGSVTPGELAEHAAAIRKARPLLTRSLTFRAIEPDGPNWPMLAGAIALLPLLGWGGWKAYRYRPQDKEESCDAAPRAIGGWLLLIALRLVLSPLLTLSSMRSYGWVFSRNSWSSMTGSIENNQRILAYLSAFEIAFLAALLVYIGIVLTVFFQKKRSFPWHYTVLTVAALAFSIYAHIVTNALSFEKEMNRSTSQVFFTGVVALLLLTYVRSSRRAAETFVK